jgi:hypothetical protein
MMNLMKNRPFVTVGQMAWGVLFFWILTSSLESLEHLPSEQPFPVQINTTIDSARFDVVPFGSNRIPRPVALISPAPTKYSASHVYALRNLNLGGMREFLERKGFAELDGMSLNQMRHLYAAWAYDDLFTQVSQGSGLPKSVAFSFFIFEATAQGIETDLFRIDLNPGGVKYVGRGQSVKRKDDCGPVPCDFRKVSSYSEAVAVWVATFNSERYMACKKGSPEAICKALVMAGYSRDKKWKGRASLCGQYEKYLKKFPKNIRKDLTS